MVDDSWIWFCGKWSCTLQNSLSYVVLKQLSSLVWQYRVNTQPFALLSWTTRFCRSIQSIVVSLYNDHRFSKFACLILNICEIMLDSARAILFYRQIIMKYLITAWHINVQRCFNTTKYHFIIRFSTSFTEFDWSEPQLLLNSLYKSLQCCRWGLPRFPVVKARNIKSNPRIHFKYDWKFQVNK